MSLLTVSTSVFGTLGDTFLSLLDSLEKKDGFNADFGRETDIASRFNKGFVISKHRKLTRKQSFENLLIAGPTGSGKTTRLLGKTLFELKNCSIIINDPSKELYQLTSGYLSQHFNIQTLNFSDSARSSGYNLLSRITKPSEVNKVADLLVRATIGKNASDPFWTLQSKILLSMFIRLVLCQPEEYRNMLNVLHLLNLFSAEPETVDQYIVSAKNEKLLIDYKAIVAMPEKTLMNVVASCKAALEIFEDPEIAKVSATDSVSFESFRTTPTILYIQNSIADQKYVSVLNSIFFEQLYGYILENLPKKSDKDLYIILEEASSLFIPVLPIAIANTRKYRVGNIICVQTPGQLTAFYKEDAANISSNCVTKLFLPGQTAMDVLRDIETLSGKCTYEDDKGKERTKSLVTIDEIRQLPTGRSLILSANHPIIKGRTSPFYRSPKYRSFAKVPPVPLASNISDEPVLLPSKKGGIR